MFQNRTISAFALPLLLALFACTPETLAQSVTVPIVEDQAGEVQASVSDSRQNRAITLLREGKSDEATREAELALEEAKAGGKKQIIASCYCVLGKILRRQDRYKESILAYEKALEYWKAQPKSQPSSQFAPTAEYMTAMILTNMGEEYESMGARGKAVDCLQEAKELVSQEVPNYWAIEENLGSIYYHLNKNGKAEEAFKLAIEKAKAGNDHRCEIDCRSNLAAVYIKSGHKKEASDTLEEAIQAVVKYHGLNDGRVLSLRRLQLAQGVQRQAIQSPKFDKLMRDGGQAFRANDQKTAQEAYAEAVKEGEKFGERDERLAVALSNLATSTNHKENPDKVIEFYKRSLKIMEGLYGAESAKLTETLYALGIVYAEQDKFGEAEPLVKRAVVLFKQSLGADNTRYIASAKLLNYLMIKNGHAEAAVAAVKTDSQEKELLEKWASCMQTGDTAMKGGNYLQAAMSYQSAMDVLESRGQPQLLSKYSATSGAALGTAYLRGGAYRKAEETINKTLPLYKQCFPDKTVTIAELEKGLAAARLKQGQ